MVVAVCQADEFFLKDTAGKEYGPFKAWNGARMHLGRQDYEVVRITTTRDAVIESMRRIMLPEVEFRQTSIQDAIGYLVKAGRENDPDKHGVNITLVPLVGLTNAPAGRPVVTNVSLSARNISLYSVIKSVRSLTGLSVCVDEAGVRFMSPDEPESDILHRQYPVEPTLTERVRIAGDEPDLRSDFAAMGVRWPRGSAISYNSSLGKVIVANTAGNLAHLERLLQGFNCVPRQVEIEAQFVRFDKSNLARLAPGSIDDKALRGLWTNGVGRLLAAPRVLTRSGSEASVRGVTEVIYPTTFVSACAAGTNTGHACQAACPAGPADFATREIGAILTVLPEVSPSGDSITLTMTPSYVESPTWRDFGWEAPVGGGKTRHFPAEQPYFHVYTYSTQLTLADGATALAGGGIPTQDGKGMVHCFVTARLLGIDGEGLKKPVEAGAVDLCEF
jgi:hypothetical protein